jgi:4-carboxymuconolactone decarboxylase
MARLTSITDKSQVAPEHQAVFDAIVASRGAVQGPFTMLMHCPELAEHFVHLGGFVRFEGKLDKRVRVLAAMTVAREFDTLYVSGSARRQNVPETTITAIREKHTRGVPAADAQVIEFTRELIRKHRVGDESAQALQARFGDEGMIEFTGAIGYYSMLCMMANAVELEAGPGAEVLKM